MILFLFTSIGLQLLNPQILRVFIDTAQRNTDIWVLTRIGCIFLAVAIGGRIVAAFANYWSQNVSLYATNLLRADLAEHCLRLDRSFYMKYSPGELIERVDGDINGLSSFFSQFVVRILGSGLFIVGILVLVTWQYPWIGMVLIVYMLLGLTLFTRLQKVGKSAYKNSRQAKANMSGFWGEALGSLEDMAVNGGANYILHRYFTLQRQERKADVRSEVYWSSYEGICELFFTSCTVLVLVMAAYLFTQGVLSIGAIVLLLSYATQLLTNTFDITDQLDTLQRATASIERINELYHTKSKVQDGPGVDFPAGPLAITFEDVSFEYEPDQPVLQHLSFSAKPGELIGVIGRTGSGKTTIARLLLRFYDPTSGVIKLGAQNVCDAHIDDLRERIGIVTQDVQLLQASLRDNITLFDPSIDDTRILEAIYALGLETWLDALPAGLDTKLSSDGMGVSAGEAQLLACVRVFLRDPQLLIFDEATSRLDPATEELVTHAMLRLFDNRTGIVIAHRLATIAHVHHIMVLHAGQIVEFGPRSELAASSTSRYAQLLHMMDSDSEEVLL
ncbi:ABC transporter ATP-binding protein [Tengunoibacter tsumagoiensis]|uniref:Helicase n=1 Tax=Tengunoibacter tsumagoiensis TaxID=2014871 RepID=A0A401ZXM5_9CHLR|nr:ABC transporter ATP-binding protein [Tengunoibacter tsumagoiensis]GCE11604.1 helicase [Tengunoibacter tsumagoiensis]